MEVRRRTRFYKKINFLDALQYLISSVIMISFAIGLIPTLYSKVYIITIGAVVLQIFISLLRLRILSVILELILLFLAVISIIPFLGYIFRFFGFLVAILDLASFKNSGFYKHVEIRTFKSKRDKKDENHKKEIKKSFKTDVKDAEFEER